MEQHMRPATPGEALLAQQNQILVQENQTRAQNEQQYYNAWQSEVNARKQLEQTVITLQQQISVLQQQLTNLSKNQSNTEATGAMTTSRSESEIKNQEQTEYFTDEEELEYETGGKHKRSNETNKAPLLDQPTHKGTKTSEEEKKESKPPSISVSNVQDFNTFKNKLLLCTFHKYPTFKTTASGEIKINTENADDYRTVCRYLRNLRLGLSIGQNDPLRGIEYHTYQAKQDRPYRFIIRGLHQTTDINEIDEELKNNGHEVVRSIDNNGTETLRITNIIKTQTIKDPKTNKVIDRVTRKLPLFRVEIKPNSNNKDVYDIKYIAQSKVTIEPPKKKQKIFHNVPTASSGDILRTIVDESPDALNVQAITTH